MSDPLAHNAPNRLRLRFGEGKVRVSRESAADDAITQPLDFSLVQARPFLKWTGGKQWLAPMATRIVPSDFAGRYFEPFLGGGSLYFASLPRKATLSDLNRELIATYRAVRDSTEAVIDELSTYPYNEGFYLALRKQCPNSRVRQAARLIYLNKTSFNGIYRVNRHGEFNVPFGRYTNPTICQPERIRAAATALQGVTLRSIDFERAVSSAGSGDFVFLDPPYITGHQNNGFRKYNATLFSWHDQERLSRVAHRLVARGAAVAVSNANHDAIRALYPDFSITLMERRSLINSVAAKRAHVPEALYTSYEPELLSASAS